MSCIGKRFGLFGLGLLMILPARASAQQCENGINPDGASLIVGTYAVSQIAMVAVRSPDWWFPKNTGFTFNWNNSNSGGQNHLLHMALSYNFSEAMGSAWRLACASEGAAAWLGALIGFAYVFPKEYGDAFRDGFGFSGMSTTLSLAGAVLPALHRTAPITRMLVMKFNYFPSDEYRNGLAPRFPQLERDYAGTNYFFAINPGLASPGRGGWPDWLGIAVGHSVDQAYQAPATHQVFFTLDVNLRGFGSPESGWHKIATFLDRFHLPLPGVKLQGGAVQFGVF